MVVVHDSYQLVCNVIVRLKRFTFLGTELMSNRQHFLKADFYHRMRYNTGLFVVDML